MAEQVYLSIIVPVYNEQKRLEQLADLLKYAESYPKRTELIVVNDGSTDDTLEKLNKMRGKGRFRIISYTPNQGKGEAIKVGMLEAVGKYRLFLDVDLSTPIDEFEKFEKLLGEYDVVIGTRKVAGARVLVRQAPLRENLGKGFSWLSKVVLGVGVSDFTCGFKCFSSQAAQKIFSASKVKRWGFDAEILFLAKKYGFSIREVPVVWKNDFESKVRFPGDLINSFYDLFTIILNDKVRRVY